MNRRVALLSLLGMAGLAAACAPVAGDSAVDTGLGYVIKVIDGCQYIEVASLLYTTAGFYSLTHKGNCNNPIHKLDKPEKAVIVVV